MYLEELKRIVSDFEKQGFPTVAISMQTTKELLAVAEAAKLVKAANAKRASAQVQDRCVREDYEQTMGYACDQLTRSLEALEKP